MFCQICNQEEATVYLIESTGDKHTTLHICENCAQKRHLGEMLSKPALAIQNLLASLLELSAAIPAGQQEIKCPACGLSFSQFREAGRFGCAACYDAFQDQLLPLLRQFHQAEEHRGRAQTPLEPLPDSDLAELKTRLHTLITNEQFEEAARLRDHIHQLEGRRQP